MKSSAPFSKIWILELTFEELETQTKGMLFVLKLVLIFLHISLLLSLLVKEHKRIKSGYCDFFTN
jgi:hypothetical protein